MATGFGQVLRVQIVVSPAVEEGASPVDPEVRLGGFAKRRDKAFFGFKMHMTVDEGSGLVRRAIRRRRTSTRAR